jgi:hypothetical protein
MNKVTHFVGDLALASATRSQQLEDFFMIFIIPFILGGAAILLGGAGIGAGIDGISKQDEANKIGKSAQGRYELAKKSLETTFRETDDLAREYGEFQIEIKLETIKRFVDFVERIKRKGALKDLCYLEGLEYISNQQLQEYKAATLEAERLASGAFKAAGAGVAASQGALGLIGLFGTASTGTAITGLSGAAAWNATLAWLGGGSLAAGGGGMALGTLVLGGIAVGPALMIGGFVLGGEGEKALTKARQYEAKVNTEIAKLSASEDFFEQVQSRIVELEKLLCSLNRRAINNLRELESREQDFTTQRDGEIFQQTSLLIFQQTALLIKAIAEILKTPVLNQEGKVNLDTGVVIAKYRNL